MITYNVNEQHSRKSTLELINNRQDRSLLYNFLFSLNIILLQVFTTFQPNLYYKMLNKCINYLSNDVCLLQYTNYVKKNGLSFQIFYRLSLYLSIWLVWFVSCYRNVTLFLVREHSECRCSLVFAVHCWIFQVANVPVHWKDFAIETALKMANSLISEQRSWLRRTQGLCAYSKSSPFSVSLWQN